ncbi:MAG: hypothetical protein ACXABU_10740 [Candidatus Hodarchaeales archaeon]
MNIFTKIGITRGIYLAVGSILIIICISISLFLITYEAKSSTMASGKKLHLVMRCYFPDKEIEDIYVSVTAEVPTDWTTTTLVDIEYEYHFTTPIHTEGKETYIRADLKVDFYNSSGESVENQSLKIWTRSVTYGIHEDLWVQQRRWNLSDLITNIPMNTIWTGIVYLNITVRYESYFWTNNSESTSIQYINDNPIDPTLQTINTPGSMAILALMMGVFYKQNITQKRRKEK